VRHLDDELENWQRQWQEQPAIPVDLRRRVEHDLRGRQLAMLGSVAVTVFMGGGTTLWAARSDQPAMLVLASAVWIFIAVAWALTLHLERLRGPWRPLADTTAGFLEYAIRSRRSRRRGIAVSAILYVLFCTFMLVWRYRTAAAAVSLQPWTYLTSAPVLTVLAISAALGGLAIYHQRRIDRELQNLVSMRDSLEPLTRDS
jgi:hypothetical protein